jgi:hypothetical protein
MTYDQSTRGLSMSMNGLLTTYVDIHGISDGESNDTQQHNDIDMPNVDGSVDQHHDDISMNPPDAGGSVGHYHDRCRVSMVPFHHILREARLRR